jgi:hypothetical protein
MVLIFTEEEYDEYWEEHGDDDFFDNYEIIKPEYHSELLYTGTGHGYINKLLRNYDIRQSETLPRYIKTGFGKVETALLLHHIRNLDELINQSGPHPGYTVFRGLPANHISFDDDVGTCVDKGFVSTSIESDIAANFTEDDCCILAFTLPPTISARKVDTESSFEFEIILQRNLEFFNIRFEKTNEDGLKLYTCGVRPYTPPTITEINYIKTTQQRLQNI